MICGKAKMLLVCLFSTLSFLTLSWTAVHAQVTLTVGKGSALPGATESPVPVSLDNPGNNIASGLTMDICDANDLLECTACETTDRTNGFSCAVNELGSGLTSGCCRVG